MRLFFGRRQQSFARGGTSRQPIITGSLLTGRHAPAHAYRRVTLAFRRPVTDRVAPVLQVGNAASLDCSDLFDLELGVPQLVEDALTVAEQHRYHVEFELVQQPCISTTTARTSVASQCGNRLKIVLVNS